MCGNCTIIDNCTVKSYFLQNKFLKMFASQVRFSPKISRYNFPKVNNRFLLFQLIKGIETHRCYTQYPLFFQISIDLSWIINFQPVLFNVSNHLIFDVSVVFYLQVSIQMHTWLYFMIPIDFLTTSLSFVSRMSWISIMFYYLNSSFNSVFDLISCRYYLFMFLLFL